MNRFLKFLFLLCLSLKSFSQDKVKFIVYENYSDFETQIDSIKNIGRAEYVKAVKEEASLKKIQELIGLPKENINLKSSSGGYYQHEEERFGLLQALRLNTPMRNAPNSFDYC